MKNRIHKDITRYWDDILRVDGFLKLDTVNSTQRIHTLQQEGKPTMLGRVIGEFGRIYKTQYLLNYVDVEEYRRKILTQLNHGESRHNLARCVFCGKRGELHQSYQEGQEDQLSALGLIVNAIVVWNTRYMEIAIDSLRKAGHDIPNGDIQRRCLKMNINIRQETEKDYKLSEAVVKKAFKTQSIVTIKSKF